MDIISKIKNLIPDDIDSNLEIEETFSTFKVELTTSSVIIPNKFILNDILNSIAPGDYLFTLNISYDDSDKNTLEPDCIEQFINGLEEETKLFPPSLTKINIIISKPQKSSIVNIYSIDDFANYLLTYDPSIILTILTSKYYNGFIIFNFISESNISNLSTTSFIFKSSEIKTTYDSIIKDLDLIDTFTCECTYIKKYDHIFTPYDFDINLSSINSNLDIAFKRFRNMFSLIFLFNISELSTFLDLKINGYKNMNVKVQFNDLINSKLDIYFNIFKWVYTDGNTGDKLNITRNILSLYLKDNRTIFVDAAVLAAIKSNHSLYLKSNVENYFEIKTKVIDNIIATNSQISDIIINLTSNFIKNLSAIGVFMITITIANSIDNGNFTDIFTPEITIISILLIFISIIYLFYTIYEFRGNKKRVETIYDRLKDNYSSILSKDDVIEILKNDKYFNEDIADAKSKAKGYIILWNTFLLCFFILIVILGDFEIINGYFKYFLKFLT